MKRVLLACLLAMVAQPCLAGKTDYYTSTNHPGRWYDCNKPGKTREGVEFKRVVRYENSDFIMLCEGSDRKITQHRSFFKPQIVTVTIDDPNSALVKSPEGKPLTTDEATAVVIRNLHDPFYDSSEKKLVRWKGAMILADLITSGIASKAGVCHEINPLPPVVSVGIAAIDWVETRSSAKKSPRVFTVSHDALAWAPVATHGFAALNNLRCM